MVYVKILPLGGRWIFRKTAGLVVEYWDPDKAEAAEAA